MPSEQEFSGFWLDVSALAGRETHEPIVSTVCIPGTDRPGSAGTDVLAKVHDLALEVDHRLWVGCFVNLEKKI